jgi:hypothetical protein
MQPKDIKKLISVGKEFLFYSSLSLHHTGEMEILFLSSLVHLLHCVHCSTCSFIYPVISGPIPASGSIAYENYSYLWYTV